MRTHAAHPSPPAPDHRPGEDAGAPAVLSDPTLTHPPRRRRLLEGVAFVAGWIGLGMLLPIGQAGHLLLVAPLAVGFQRMVRRRPVLELWARGGGKVARDRWDRAAFTALALSAVASFVARGLGDDQWVETFWTAGVMAVAFAAGYLIFRRAFVAFTVAAMLVAATGWLMTPQLSAQRSGDPQLLAQLTGLEGYRDLSVAVVDLSAPQQVRYANTGSTNTTRFEVGSITKALTGLVIADAVKRGEVNLASPVSAYLPLKGARSGSATMRQLVTHTSGYPADSSATFARAMWSMPLGLSPVSTNLDQTMQEIHGAALSQRGTFAYSNLGAAAAGQATASAAGMSYPDLMATRLFEPMRMTDTTVQTRPMVAGGKGASGRPVQPWVEDGLAPAGGVVSTSKDLSILATAILNGTAPGLDALTGTTATATAGTDHGMSQRIGVFWHSHRHDDSHVMTGHSGMTGGYSSYLGFDLVRRKAVIVLSDVARSVDDLGMDLLSQDS
jgi:CubicO group peptidase (beta-lactamase class C family)